MALFPLSLATGGTAPPSGPGLQPGQANRGTLYVGQDSFDFGHVTQATKVSHTFYLKNTGDDSLFISKVHAMCGCTSAPLTKDKLAPGERVPLVVTFSSGKMTGHVRKSLTIYSSDSNKPMVPIEFSANVGSLPATLALEPGTGIDLASFASAAAAEGKVALTNVGAVGANLKIVSSSPEFLEARLSANRIEPSQAAELIVKTKVGVPVGRFAGTVTVMIEGGANARFSIPVTGESKAN